jgi:hypothetical protein
MVEDMKPVWEEFIVGLGYSKKKGKLFADGYAAAIEELPLLEKLRALEQQDDECMTAGFEAARIEEDEAFRRYSRL